MIPWKCMLDEEPKELDTEKSVFMWLGVRYKVPIYLVIGQKIIGCNYTKPTLWGAIYDHGKEAWFDTNGERLHVVVYWTELNNPDGSPSILPK